MKNLHLFGILGALLISSSSLCLDAQTTPATSPAAAPATTTTTTSGKPATPAANSTAQAPTPTPAPTTSAQPKLVPIIVTGSTIPTTDTEGASEVITVNSQDLAHHEDQTVADILKHLPINGSGSSFGGTSGNFAAGGAYISLRSLGPQATLVLINGRRVTSYGGSANGQYPFVDLNEIPADIVDRVEILTTGTAIYGSDAVGGVVNIITKKDIGDNNGIISTHVGQTDHNDGFEQRYSVEGSLDSFDHNGTGFVQIDYQTQDSIYAINRQISATANQTVNGGIDLRSGRTFPGIFVGDTSGNVFSFLPGRSNTPLTSDAQGKGADPFLDPNANALQPYNYNANTTLIPYQQRFGTFGNYQYKYYDGNVIPDLEFTYRHSRTVLQQAAAGYASFDGDAGPTGTPSAAAAATGFLGATTFIVPANNPYNHTNEQIDIASYRFNDVGPRIETVNTDFFHIVPNVHIVLPESWTSDTAYNYSYNFTNDKNLNAISASAFQNALKQTDPNLAYNPFISIGQGQNSQSVINSILGDSGSRNTSSLEDITQNFEGGIYDLPGGSVQLSVGAEYFKQRLNQTYTSQDLAGDIISSSIQNDIAASRRALSGYSEIDIPVFGPGFTLPGFHALDFYADGRVDDYSQFGHTVNPQARFRWEPYPGLVVRGSYSTAFRAPSLNELDAPNNQAFTTIIDPQQGNSTYQVLLNGGGNAALKPEEAETFQGGVAYSPEFIKGLEIHSDLYKIRYTNQIQQINPQELIQENSPLVIRNAGGTITSVTDVYENLASSIEKGIDFGSTYVLGNPQKDWGQLTLSYQGTFVFDFFQKADSTSDYQDVAGTDSGGLGGFPRYKHDISATWDYRSFEFNVTNDFTGPYQDSNAVPLFYRSVSPYTLFNLQASYTFDKSLDKELVSYSDKSGHWMDVLHNTTVAVGVNNVWDTQPVFTANPANTLGYDPTISDPTGRFLYFDITKKF